MGNEIIKPNTQLYDTQYIVEKNIGAGGDGYIYIVHHKSNPKVKYAAKVFRKPDELDEKFWRKHANEATTAIRISQRPNPNLAKTYDAFVAGDNEIVFIMEYINGVTLKTYLDNQGCLTPKVALNIFKKLLNGIKQLHSYKQKIIHRDLKPENIMVSHDLSKVVIVDFGVSSVIFNDKEVLTDETDLIGTPTYILPDLLEEYGKKNKTISVQSDFFSLGVILYAMIMGTLPFEPVNTGHPVSDKRATIRLAKEFDIINISANPTIPTSLENIIFRCMASMKDDVKYRYTDIQQIIDDVNRCIPLLDKKDDPTPLLKPLNRRFYQKEKQIDVDYLRSEQKGYKQWWAFAIIFGLAASIIIVSIIIFFVI